MGTSYSRASFDRLFTVAQEQTILVLGLDASGKTTIVWKSFGEVTCTVPAIGFGVETWTPDTIDDAHNLSILEKAQSSLWRHYFQNCTAIIFVVDAHDRERFQEAQEELEKLLEEEQLESVVLLVLANKQDLTNIATMDEIRHALHLPDVAGNRRWKLFGCAARKGDGVLAAMQWLSDELIHRPPPLAPAYQSNRKIP